MSTALKGENKEKEAGNGPFLKMPLDDNFCLFRVVLFEKIASNDGQAIRQANVSSI